MTRHALGLVLLATWACGGPTGRGRPEEPTPPHVAAPADSLALQLLDGTAIWFLEGREATDEAGAPCYERTIEIRDSAGRRRVPLLYTLEAPVRLDDTSVSARIFSGCRPGDSYRVSLRTGRPTPMAP